MASGRLLRFVIPSAALLMILAVLSLAAAGQQSAGDIVRFNSECAQGKYDRCFILGSAYLAGDGVAKNEAHAAELLQRACNGGIVQGCSTLGYMYMSGTGTAKD